MSVNTVNLDFAAFLFADEVILVCICKLDDKQRNDTLT